MKIAPAICQNSRRMKSPALFLIATVFLFWSAAPSFAAKAALSDEELDRTTATGPSDINRINGSSVAIDSAEKAINNLTIQQNSQGRLQALVTNNVAGNNMVGTAINIIGGINAAATPR